MLLIRIIFWLPMFLLLVLTLPATLLIAQSRSGCMYRHEWMKWFLGFANKPFRSHFNRPCGGCW